MTGTGARFNGLAAWRARQAVERQERIDALDVLRESATVEVIDGQEYRVVRIPDRYGEERDASKAIVRVLPRQRNRLSHRR